MRKLVDLKSAAEQLSLKTATLRAWRLEGKFLEFVKVGGSVRVTQASIDHLINSNVSR
jgi:predicted site-specific integrase-resolvase